MKKMNNWKKGVTIIETSIITALMSMGYVAATNSASTVMEQAEQRAYEAHPEDLENPFGEVTEAEEEAVAAILKRAIGDPELEAMARKVNSMEGLEELRQAVLNKYHYVSAPARSSRALAMMSKYDF